MDLLRDDDDWSGGREWEHFYEAIKNEENDHDWNWPWSAEEGGSTTGDAANDL